MKTQAEIEERIEFLKNQKVMSVQEFKYTAAAIFQAEIKTLEWVIS